MQKVRKFTLYTLSLAIFFTAPAELLASIAENLAQDTLEHHEPYLNRAYDDYVVDEDEDRRFHELFIQQFEQPLLVDHYPAPQEMSILVDPAIVLMQAFSEDEPFTVAHGLAAPLQFADEVSNWRLESDGTLYIDGGFIGGVGRWESLQDYIFRIVITAPVQVMPNGRALFRSLINVTEIVGTQYIDTSNTTNMSDMFLNMRSLETLDLSSFDTSQVTLMNNMFQDTHQLSSLNLSSFDTGAVTSFFRMFANTGLRYVDLSHFDTSSAVTMQSMFIDSQLAYLDLSGFDTHNVQNFHNFLIGTRNLSDIDVTNFDTRQVQYFGNMFRATSLRVLDLSGFHMSADSQTSHMFWASDNLATIVLGEGVRFSDDSARPVYPPRSYPYTGFWRHVGDGTSELPLGRHRFTSLELVRSFNGGDMAGAWVWERQDHPPISEPIYELTIEIHGNGSVFTANNTFVPGEAISLIAIPDALHYLSNYRANITNGTEVGLLTDDQFFFTFIVPDADTTLHFYFSESIPLNDTELELPVEIHEAVISQRPFTAADVMQSVIDPYFQFVHGEIIVVANRYMSYDDMEQLATSLGGEIVGWLQVANTFQLYFTGIGELRLNLILNELDSLDTIYTASLNAVVRLNQDLGRLSVELPWPFQSTEEPLSVRNWGLYAINAPAVWPEHSIMTPINIGIMDTSFTNHVDLPHMYAVTGNEWYWDDQLHGTHVAGIIGSTASLDDGRVGVLWNRERRTLFTYSLSNSDAPRNAVSLFQYQHGLAKLFAENVRLINVSMGLTFRGHEYLYSHNFKLDDFYYHQRSTGSLTQFLSAYLDAGHEFLIVQAAGNNSNTNFGSEYSTGWVDAGYSGLFINITEPNIRDRVLVVGNMRAEGLDPDGLGTPTNFTHSSNSRIGPRVDIFAPGTRIFSTGLNDSYTLLDGTSMAAPHVTGVAGLVWGVNPDLTGAQVASLVRNMSHPDIEINVDVYGDIQTFPALYAPGPVRAAQATLGQGSGLFTHNTLMGEIRIPELEEQPELQVSFQIFRYSDEELMPQSPIRTTFVDGRNFFMVNLPRDKYIFQLIVDGIPRRNIVYDFEFPLPYVHLYIPDPSLEASVWLNNQPLTNANGSTLTALPHISEPNGHLMLPLRAMAENLGYHVLWNSNGSIVLHRVLGNQAHTTTIRLNNSSFTTITRHLAEDYTEMPVTRSFNQGLSPVMVDGSTFLPLEAMTDILDFTYFWNPYLRRLDVSAVSSLEESFYLATDIYAEPVIILNRTHRQWE